MMSDSSQYVNTVLLFGGNKPSDEIVDRLQARDHMESAVVMIWS
jgi:hypothetical protein